ncbi:MAG TPA: hypothetical protein VMC82_03500 [Thermoplasmata archaeon]|nr:hypothetical protein [Thermoplasmata archaeon]
MNPSRAVILLWSALIVGLLIVEFAEITRVFTLPLASAFGDPYTVLFALVFTTILALVGAIFIGIYFSARVLRSQGFTPFEEEMLRMRADISEIKAHVDRLTPTAGPADPTGDPPRARP